MQTQFSKMKTLAIVAATVLAATGEKAVAQDATAKDSAEPFGKQVSSADIRHSFFIAGSKTAIIGEDNSIVWQVPQKSRDGFVLPSGNVLVSHYKSVAEYTRKGKKVFEYKLSKGNSEMGTASRLENGNTLIVERGAKPQLVEVNASAEIVATIPLKPDTDNAHMQTRMARKLPNGNYLVPHLLGFVVKEYKPNGDVVREIKTDLQELGGRKAENWPFTAILLEDGNVLVNLTHGNKTVEFDQAGKVAWRVDNPDVGNRFADPCGGQRLPNGNTVICAYGQRKPKMAKVFEITRDKKVVWEYINPKHRGIHEIHVLTTNGKPIAGRPLK